MSTAPAFMEDPDKSESGHEVGVVPHPRAEYRGKNFRAEIVSKGDDLIYQFFRVKKPDFRGLLAEVIESHFGGTTQFSAAYVPEVESLGVLAKGVAGSPFFSYDHYTVHFLDLVDTCLGEL